MFGIIVAGRLVQTDFEQVDTTRFLLTIPEADNINHIVVFMTGQSPFPYGMGGAVYFAWPTQAGIPSWSFLGHISNDKPSSIFKISALKTGGEGGDNPFMTQASSHRAQVGVSVEPLQQIAQQTPAVSTQTLPLDSMMQFTQRTCESLFNYLASFAVTQAQMVPSPTESFVPFSELQKWFETFQRKLTLDPFFWRS